MIRSYGWLLMFASLATLSACSSGDDGIYGGGTFDLQPGTPRQIGTAPTGVLFEVDVGAVATGGRCVWTDQGPDCSLGLQGVSVAAVAQPAAITVSPSAALSDENGIASFVALVPFGASGELVLTGGGSTATVPLDDSPADGGGPSLQNSMPMFIGTAPTGELYQVDVGAAPSDVTCNWIATGSSCPGGLLGVSVAAAGQPSTITVSPGTESTNASGVASFVALVPFGSSGEMVLTGGGTILTVPLKDALPNGLQNSTPQIIGTAPTGVLFQIEVGAESGTGVCAWTNGGSCPDPLLGVSIAAVGQPSTITVSPGSESTNANGIASFVALVPFGSSGELILSGGGATLTVPLKDALPNGLQNSMPMLIGTAPTGVLFQVEVGAESGTGVCAWANGGSCPDPLLGVSIAAVGQPSSITVSPGSESTNANGIASFVALVPFGSSGELVLTGGGATGAVALSDALQGGAGVTLQNSTPVIVGTTPTGVLFQVEVGVQSGVGNCSWNNGGSCPDGLPGVPVAAAGQPSAITVSPGTESTDANGIASFVALVPFGSSGQLVLTGGGATAAVTLSDALSGGTGVNIQNSTPLVVGTTPTGVLFQVEVGVQSGVGNCSWSNGGSCPDGLPGVAVAAAGQPSTIAVSPGNESTNANGIASFVALVPFGTSGELVLTGGGAIDTVTLSDGLPGNGAVGLLNSTPQSIGTTPTGVLFQIDVGAVSSGSTCDFDNGGSCTDGLLGVSVAAIGQPSAITVTPATESTDAGGVASFVVLVPFGVSGELVLTGGGTIDTVAVGSASIPVLTVDAGTPDNTATGAVFPVTAQLQFGGTGLAAVPVTFAVSGGGATVAAATVSTNASGEATTYVQLGYNGTTMLVATAAGAEASTALTTLPEALKVTCKPGDDTNDEEVDVLLTADDAGVPGTAVTFTYESPPATVLGSATTGGAGDAGAQIPLVETPETLVVSAGGLSKPIVLPTNCSQ